MILDVPPGFPVSFTAFAVGDTLFLSAHRGSVSTRVFWHAGVWAGPGKVSGGNPALRISGCVSFLWEGRIPDGLVESLVWQLRDPPSLILSLDVMES